jgi:hypothetical protein
MFGLDPRAGALERPARYAILGTLGMEKIVLCELDDRHVQKSGSASLMAVWAAKVKVGWKTRSFCRQSALVVASVVLLKLVYLSLRFTLVCVVRNSCTIEVDPELPRYGTYRAKCKQRSPK